MKSSLLLIVLLFISNGIIAQIIAEGVVKEAGSGNPLAYVNIGLVGKGIGTVSDDAGKFKLTIPEANAMDTVRVSMLGYAPQVFTVSDFIKQLADQEISLQTSSFLLPDVIISSKELKERVLGNPTVSQRVSVGFTSNRLGNELGMIIKIKKAPTFIKSFTASVVSKDNKPIKLRLNFYTLKDGLPDKLIQDKNIFVNAPVQNGKLFVDLDSYNIVAEDDFFVSLEWIESASGNIMFSGSLMNGALISRETSQADWERIRSFGIGFTVKAAY